MFAGSKFCGQCGADTQELLTKAAAALCPRCDAGNSLAAKFCRSCGAALTGGRSMAPQAEPKL